MEHSNLKKSKKKGSKSCIEDPEVSTNKTRTNGSFTALFIRVTVYSLNPLEKLLFMRGVLFLLPQDGSREWPAGSQLRPAEAASTAGSGGAAPGGAERTSAGLSHGSWRPVVAQPRTCMAHGGAAPATAVLRRPR